MAATEYPLTRADFDRSNWQEAIAVSPTKECFSFSNELFKKLDESKRATDEVATAVFTVLYAATSIALRADEPDMPFGSRFVNSVARGAEPDDITNEQYRALAEIAPSVIDPEMRARLCDILWVVKRDYKLAKLAVDAYLDSARSLYDPEKWPHCEERIRRAVTLGRMLGGGGSKEFEKAIAYVEEIFNHLNGEDSSYLTCRLLQLLQEFQKGDPKSTHF